MQQAHTAQSRATSAHSEESCTKRTQRRLVQQAHTAETSAERDQWSLTLLSSPSSLFSGPFSTHSSLSSSPHSTHSSLYSSPYSTHSSLSSSPYSTILLYHPVLTLLILLYASYRTSRVPAGPRDKRAQERTESDKRLPAERRPARSETSGASCRTSRAPAGPRDKRAQERT